MSTSGSYDFSQTRNEIIRKAFLRIKQVDLVESAAGLDAVHQAFAEDILNAMLKHWQVDDLYLWNLKEGTLFLANNTYQYSLGPTGDHATLSSAYTLASANAAAVSGASTLDKIGRA